MGRVNLCCFFESGEYTWNEVTLLFIMNLVCDRSHGPEASLDRFKRIEVCDLRTGLNCCTSNGGDGHGADERAIEKVVDRVEPPSNEVCRPTGYFFGDESNVVILGLEILVDVLLFFRCETEVGLAYRLGILSCFSTQPR